MGVNPFDRVSLGWDGLFGDRTMFYSLTPGPLSLGWRGMGLGLRLENSSGLGFGNGMSGHTGGGGGGGAGILMETITVPVLDLDKARFVETGTVGVIVLGFLWVCWKLLRPLAGGGRAKRKKG